MKLPKSTTEQSKTIQNNIAVAYLRVSTKEQGEEGGSLEAQRTYAKAYAEKHGLELDDPYIFEEMKPASKVYGITYDNETSIYKRPIMNQIVKLAGQGKFHKFIVYSRDRLTRNVEEYFALKCLFNKYKIELCYSDPTESYFSSTSKEIPSNNKAKTIESLIEIVLTSIAELESNIIGSRVRLGNQHCIHNGVWAGGKVPFGYKAEEVQLLNSKRKNSVLSYIPYEKEIIKEIFQYYNNYGYSYSKLAEIINKKYPFKTWTKSSIESILTNQIYTGYLVWGRRGGRRNPGKRDDPRKSEHIPDMEIINQTTWDQSVALRHNKSPLKDAKYYSSPFLLKGKLFCGCCGSMMKCKNYGPTKKKAYRCPTIGDKNKSELILSNHLVESNLIKQLSTIIKFEDISYLWDLYSDERDVKTSKANNLVSGYLEKIDELREQVSEITQVINSQIDYSIKLELNQLLTLTEKKIEHFEQIIESENKALNFPHNSIDDFELSLNEFFTNFEHLEIYNKRMIIDLIIDKVVVNLDDDKNLHMEITLNPPQNI